MNPQKKLVVITGASAGIGQATAELFAKAGYPLLLLARGPIAVSGPNVMTAKADVTDVDQLTAAIEKAEARFGAVDCLVNNAGIMLLGNAAKQDPAEWQKMLNVNVMGVLNGIHAVLPGMIARKGGTVIDISSIAGRKTFPNHAAYCGTKFAVHAITENIREEVAAHNVRMITIAPGAVETKLLSHTTSEEIKAGYNQWKEAIGGAIAPEVIAEAVLYAYQQPQSVCVREIVIAATRQGT